MCDSDYSRGLTTADNPFQLEHGVPLPPRKKFSLCNAIEETVRAMNAGDSIFVACSNAAEAAVRRCQLDNAVRLVAWRNRLEWRFSSRLVDGGVRIWRAS